MRVYLALLLCCWSISASAREISGCGHPEYPPVSWVDNTTLVGVAPSVARHLFAELGYTLTLDTSGNWERCLQEVKAGNIDVVLAAYRTEARSEFLHYLDNYLVADPLSIFIRTADESEYRSLQDLSGKRVGLLLGDSFGDAVDQFLKQHTRREFVSKGAQNFAKLAYSRIDL
ncbi:MAG: substrate-binding periplasmic protein, partial [Pseudomonadales bacterium]